MNRFLFITVFFSLTALGASAQTLRFKNGRTAELPDVRIANNQLRMPADPANPSAGEVSFPLSSLERIDWPAPPELARISAALKAGKLGDALKDNDAFLARQEPFRDIPGSWWPQTLLLRAEILARLGRVADSEAVCEQLRLSPLGARLADRARVSLLDALAVSGNRNQVRERLASLSPETLADKTVATRVDLIRARLLQAEGKTEDALLTYLRIPVLYSAQTDPAPAALLGAASCLRALGENTRAETHLRTVIERFPDSPEAAEARTLLPAS